MGFGKPMALILTGMLVWWLALISVLRLPETYGTDMDRVE
jgi:hypothetical protein